MLSLGALSDGFGLLNIHGIAKPSYRAFELLHGLGTELMALAGAHLTVDAWLVRGGGKTTILLTNFALPCHAIATEAACVALRRTKSVLKATMRRGDSEHANAKRRWEEMGKPEYVSAGKISEEDVASRRVQEAQPTTLDDGLVRFEVALPPQSVDAIEFAY